MNISDYSVQEPLSDFGRKHYLVMARRSAQLLAVEHAYLPDSPCQKLLFFGAQKPDAPLLLFFHGGGWTNGYKEYAAFMGPLFALSGIAFAAVGYRMAPEHVFPQGWNDCAAAVQWCHAHSGQLGISSQLIFAGGYSAGAHYASLLATRQDWQTQRELPADVIKGCLAISGSYRFDAQAGFAMRPRFLGAEELQNDAPASPILHAGSHCPPHLVSWGEWDFPHLILQAHEYCEALRAQGVAVDTLELPERDHLGAGLAGGELQGPWFAAARAWVEARCRGIGQ
jgi:acetyl esterase/lipase